MIKSKNASRTLKILSIKIFQVSKIYRIVLHCANSLNNLLLFLKSIQDLIQ